MHPQAGSGTLPLSESPVIKSFLSVHLRRDVRHLVALFDERKIFYSGVSSKDLEAVFHL